MTKIISAALVLLSFCPYVFASGESRLEERLKTLQAESDINERERIWEEITEQVPINLEELTVSDFKEAFFIERYRAEFIFPSNKSFIRRFKDRTVAARIEEEANDIIKRNIVELFIEAVDKRYDTLHKMLLSLASSYEKAKLQEEKGIICLDLLNKGMEILSQFLSDDEIFPSKSKKDFIDDIRGRVKFVDIGSWSMVWNVSDNHREINMPLKGFFENLCVLLLHEVGHDFEYEKVSPKGGPYIPLCVKLDKTEQVLELKELTSMTFEIVALGIFANNVSKFILLAKIYADYIKGVFLKKIIASRFESTKKIAEVIESDEKIKEFMESYKKSPIYERDDYMKPFYSKDYSYGIAASLAGYFAMDIDPSAGRFLDKLPFLNLNPGESFIVPDDAFEIGVEHILKLTKPRTWKPSLPPHQS